VVLNVQDLFPQNAVDAGLLRNPLLIRGFIRLERRVYAGADKILVHSPGNREFLMEKRQVPETKVEVLPNWVDLNRPRRAGFLDFRSRWGLAGKFLLLFGGVMGPTQGLEMVVEAAQRLQAYPEIVFLLVGDGTARRRLEQEVHRRRLPNVVFQPFLEPAAYWSLLNEADAGLLTLSPKVKTPVVPSKLLGYLAAGKPYIAAVNPESDAAAITRASGAGLYVPAGNAEAFSHAVLKLYRDKELAREMGLRGREFARVHFSHETWLDRYEALLLDCAEAPLRQPPGALRRTISPALGNLLLFVGDLAIFSLCLGFGLIGGAAALPPPGEYLSRHWFLFFCTGSAFFLILYLADLYDCHLDFRRLPNLARVLAASALGLGLIVISRHLLSTCLRGGCLLLMQMVCCALLLTLWRWAFSAAALPERLTTPVLVAGTGTTGPRILEEIRHLSPHGVAVKGFITDDPAANGHTILGIPVLGDLSRLPEIVRRYRVKLLILAVPPDRSAEWLGRLTRLPLNGCRLVDLPGFYERLAGKVLVDYLSEARFLPDSLSGNPFYCLGKRLFDLLTASVILLLTWPLWLAIMAAIRWDTPGPLFFRQTRLGQHGRPFQILKFRTMHHGLCGSEPRWTRPHDPRVTRVGRFLRRTHLDELPQLINVLKGEMSLVGPRAEWEVFARQAREKVPVWRSGCRSGQPSGTRGLCGYQERLPFYSYRLTVKPGITGWAQVMFPCAGSSLEDLKEKLQYDLYYVKNRGFLLDLLILLKTVRVVLGGRGK
ncbi:MAG: sugar transferase, partial [Deltaproteobacteria bacterium]|nr:sugar transferase [Deltaproteobacteria bacterium]